MKYLLAALLVLSLSACASLQERRNNYWSEIQPGMTREEVVKHMGKPDDWGKSEKTGRDYIAWGMNSYTACAVAFSKENGTVEEKRCRVDEAQRAIAAQQAQAAMQMYLQMQGMRAPAAPSSSYQMPIYHAPQTIQTNCQSGGYNSVNCTSRPTGIDTSIYGR